MCITGSSIVKVVCNQYQHHFISELRLSPIARCVRFTMRRQFTEGHGFHPGTIVSFIPSTDLTTECRR